MKKARIGRPPLHDNYELPTREELLAIKKGSIVKVLLIGKEITERIWTIVKAINSDEVVAEINNEPFNSEYTLEQEITFHPYDIISIWIEEEPKIDKEYLVQKFKGALKENECLTILANNEVAICTQGKTGYTPTKIKLEMSYFDGARLLDEVNLAVTNLTTDQCNRIVGSTFAIK